MSLPLKEIINVQLGVSSGGPGIAVDIPVRGLALSKYEWEMRVGDTDQLYALFNPTNAVQRAVFWSEDTDGNIISVDNKGEVTGIGIGKGYVTCITEDGAYRARCYYNILRALIPVTSVTFDQSTKTLEEGQSFKLNATVLPANADDKELGWFSTNNEVATVSEDGTVVAHKAGVVSITALAASGVSSAPCIVTVVPPPVFVTAVYISDTEAHQVVGDVKQLDAYVKPDDATNQDVTWKSDKPLIVSVDADGNTTCHAVGTATITVTTVDGGYSATCVFTVIAAIVRVTGVNITNTLPLEVDQGNTVQMTFEVTPADATDKTVSWSSSDEDVLIVSPTGLVTGTGAGVAQVTATTNDGSFTSSVDVTVINRNIAVTSVAWAADSPTSVPAGHQAQTKIVILPADATNKNVLYNSSNTAAVTIDTDGIIYGQAGGTSTLTVTTEDGGKIATMQVTCTVVSVIVPDGLGGMPVGGTMPFTYQLVPPGPALTNIVYESADPTIATVDADGTVTAIKAGGCNIRITGTQNGIDLTATTWADVSANVQCYPQYVEWLVGNTQQLDVQYYPSDSKNVTLTYTSSDPATISVSNTGLMTAHKEGSAKIDVGIVMNGVAGAGDTSPYVTKLSMVTDSTTALVVGATAQLGITVRPAYALDDPDYVVEYTTTDASIATVSPTGVITAIAAGDCRVGAIARVRDASDSDSSYQAVSAS